MRDYVKLMRPQHYIKNFLIILPTFFAGEIFNKEIIAALVGGWLSFSLIASTVYIINDIRDVEKDRMHEVKKKRPIAAGRISKIHAIVFACVLICIAELILGIVMKGMFNSANLVLLGYLIINVLYSVELKNHPIIDVIILASGFVLRVIFGSSISGCIISQWFLLTIMMFSLYMGLGKRRNEFRKMSGGGETRKVLSYYTEEFLDRNMLLTLTLGLVFYSFWSAIVVPQKKYMVWTVPVVVAIIMKYELDIEKDSFGDPVDVLMSDKILMVLVFIYSLIILGLIYWL